MFRSVQGWLRAMRCRREFEKLMRAHDRAIANARKRHAPTRGLIEAKRAFVHSKLAAEVGRAPDAWRGR